MVNEVPLSVYNVMFVITIGLVIFTFINRENIIRSVTAFISTILSYMLSFISLNGNLVSISETNTLYIITSTSLNYFWLFIAIMMGIFTVLFIIDEININLITELEEANAEE